MRHDAEKVVAWTGGGGLELTNTRDALTVTATLPNIPLADRALAEVRAGKLRGFSIEFESVRERQDKLGLRVVQQANLSGIGWSRRRATSNRPWKIAGCPGGRSGQRYPCRPARRLRMQRGSVQVGRIRGRRPKGSL